MSAVGVVEVLVGKTYRGKVVRALRRPCGAWPWYVTVDGHTLRRELGGGLRVFASSRAAISAGRKWVRELGRA